MKKSWLGFALGLVALASGPVAMVAWNQGMGKGGFATPLGGEMWYATHPGFFEADGVGDPELSPLGHVFNWTEGGKATLRFPRLDRSRPARVTVRIQGGAPSRRTTPEAVFAVDGVEVQRLPVPSAPRRVSVELPRRRGRGAVVSIRIEGSVGVMIENVRLTPTQGALPIPREAMGALALVTVVWYGAALLSGGSPWFALAVALAQATLFAWIAVTGGAFLGRYSERLAWLAAIGFVLSLAALRFRDLRWRRAWIAVFSVAILKLSILGHPQIIDADAAGHARNLGRVLSGDWFFTSATPPPAISFPYPPGLSVAALPFSDLPRSQWVTLLRTLVVTTEIIAAATFGLAVAALSTEAVGAMTFLLLTLSPEGVAVLFIGNLSNLFSDALMIFGCSFLITRRPVMASLSLLGGFLSHFGTLLLGAPLSLVLALISGPRPLPAMRRIAPVLAALALSFLLYYRRFGGVVVEAWDRITHLNGAAGVGPMTAPVAEKLSRIGGGEDWWIHALELVAVVIGVATWPKDRRGLARILFAWILVVAGFALLGVFTPVQVRSGLSARPAMATLCASGVCALWSRGGRGRGLACLIVLLTLAACGTIGIGFFPTRAAR
jgi:hypothetical protein